MILNAVIIYSWKTDPWYNLAMEEYLLDIVSDGTYILFLYCNNCSVVIGKNQNPWKECNVDLLIGDGGKLARRISGGGAVYHDMGNINFSFIGNRNYCDIAEQLDLIIEAIRQLDIPAEKNIRRDLVVGGCKFSGNAFCYRKDKVLHHGTILVSVDKKKLHRYLNADNINIKTRAVASVRSNIINLEDIHSSITVQMVLDSIIDVFKKKHNEVSGIQKDILFPAKDRLYTQHSSWEWLFGRTPQFIISFEITHECGNLVVEMVVGNGIITSVSIDDTSIIGIDKKISEKIQMVLVGTLFNTVQLPVKIAGMNIVSKYSKIIADIVESVKRA